MISSSRFAPLFTLVLLFSLISPGQAESSPFSRAFELDQQGFIEETIPFWEEHLSKTTERGEKEIYAAIKLSIALTHTGHLAEAKKIAEELTVASPENYDAWFNLAAIESIAKEYPDATAAYKNAIALQANEGLAYVGLGLNLFGQGDTKDALKTLRQVRKLFKKQKNISWYQNVKIMIGQMKSFAPYPADFSALWLKNNLDNIKKTFESTLMKSREDSLYRSFSR